GLAARNHPPTRTQSQRLPVRPPAHPGVSAMSPRHIFIPALFAAALSACSILPAPEPLDLYMLPGGFPPAEQNADSGPTLRVLRPSSVAQLAGRAITVIPDDQRVSVYKNAAWTDPAPQ